MLGSRVCILTDTVDARARSLCSLSLSLSRLPSLSLSVLYVSLTFSLSLRLELYIHQVADRRAHHHHHQEGRENETSPSPPPFLSYDSSLSSSPSSLHPRLLRSPTLRSLPAHYRFETFCNCYRERKKKENISIITPNRATSTNERTDHDQSNQILHHLRNPFDRTPEFVVGIIDGPG